MLENPKHAIISSFVSRTKDRFQYYNEEKTLEERFEFISKINGIKGVEIVYPYEANDPNQLLELLKKYSLEVSAVNANIKAEPEFKNGSLTSKVKEVRKKAVSIIKKAKEFAKKIGVSKVTCCPLSDGYEFSFQYNYAKTWDYLIETIGEAGNYLPEITLFIEYKPSETRGKCFIDTASKALILLNEIGNKNIGITIDFGHSVYGLEHPPEAISLVNKSPFPFYIHINDNDGRWDWDYFVGTKNFLTYVEFLFYLQEYNYNDFLTSDTSPTRWDIKETFEANVRLTNKI